MKKIPTLYERVFENHKIVDCLPNILVGCEDAYYKGIATEKIDGSCCAIIDGKFYKRYDAKGGKTIPVGAIKCQEEPDKITGHLPCWVLVDKDNPADKWFYEAYYNTCMWTNNGLNLEDGTYEAVGKHFNGNPYNYNEDSLVKHGVQVIEVERSFDAIKNYLKEHYIEGIVFWLDGQPVCKIKRSDFGFEWNKK